MAEISLTIKENPTKPTVFKSKEHSASQQEAPFASYPPVGHVSSAVVVFFSVAVAAAELILEESLQFQFQETPAPQSYLNDLPDSSLPWSPFLLQR